MPIAPGYRVLKESRDIEFTAGSPPAVQIQSTYILENSGSTDLDFVDVTLPVAAIFGRMDTHAELDGHATALSPLPAELQFDSPDDMRISFDSKWKQGEKHDLTIEYTLRSPVESGSRITLSENDFHLGSQGAFDVLEPPKHLLAPLAKRPDLMYYTVRVPADFRLLAPGKLAGRKQENAGVEYRYRLEKNDLAIYVAAGRYAESAPLGASGAVFWTFQPMTIDAGAANAITSAWNTLVKDYGPLDASIRGPHIVEASDLPVHITGGQGASAAPFPGGALVNTAALAEGAGSAAFIEAVSHALAHNWFGDEIYPAADATLGLGEGLPEYATIVIDEARGGAAARRRRIAQYISEYDAGLQHGKEETLAVARLTDPPEERRIALAKAPLFFAALEDECGADTMQAGLKEIVTLLRGQEVSYAALRSELEAKSGKDLAPTFRLWLNEKGIPDDFRQRYQGN